MEAKRTTFSFVGFVQAKENKHDGSMSREQRVFLDALYQQYYSRVLAYFCYRIGRRDAVEDLASLVFERAITHIADIHSKDSAAAWLFRIAQNCAHDYFRQQRPEVSLEELAITESPQKRSLEEHVLADEERRRLLAHVSRLSERDREIIGLKFVAHLTNRQIAHVLNMPEGTVSSLLYRTLGKLRDGLRTEEDSV